MRTNYDASVVILSFAVAMLGSYVCISLCELYRLYTMKLAVSKFINPRLYLAFMALSLGLVGIWSMHFIGMSAISLKEPGVDSHPPIRYDIPMTVTSLVLVLMFSLAGISVASYDRVFTKTKREIMELFVQDASHLTFLKIKKMSTMGMLYLIATNSLQHLVGGGLLAGAGVVVMHYVGMSAMHFPGRIVWNYGIIASSVIISFIAATAAFFILFRLLSIFPNKEILRVTSSFLMAVAVCGMHYSGMQAATFEFDDSTSEGFGLNGSGVYFTSSQAFSAGVVIAMIVSILLMALALADMRFAVLRLSGELSRADDLIIRLDTERGNAVQQHVRQYLQRRKLRNNNNDNSTHSDLTPNRTINGQNRVLGGFNDDGSVSSGSRTVDRSIRTARRTDNTNSSSSTYSKQRERNASDQSLQSVQRPRHQQQQQQNHSAEDTSECQTTTAGTTAAFEEDYFDTDDDYNNNRAKPVVRSASGRRRVHPVAAVTTGSCDSNSTATDVLLYSVEKEEATSSASAGGGNYRSYNDIENQRSSRKNRDIALQELNDQEGDAERDVERGTNSGAAAALIDRDDDAASLKSVETISSAVARR